jgi:hypothetical protein
MQFVLLIYESPEAFETRQNDSYTGAWRAYYKALVEAGIFVAGDPLEVPETGTTVRATEGSAAYRMDLTLTPRSNWEGSPSWNSPRWMLRSIGQLVAQLPRMGLWRSVR